MIPTSSSDIYEAAMHELAAFSDRTNVRGKFVSMYLGFRLMGDQLAPLGSSEFTTSSEIESFLDRMWTKTHIPDPLRVLTAAFGTSDPNGPYKTVSGQTSPTNAYPTNNWRNHFRLQKGVGCNGDAELVAELVATASVDPRPLCPHFGTDEDGHFCAITAGTYRGERHAIWLSGPPGKPGFQVVDLDQDSAYGLYLAPLGERIPLMPLLAVLYSFTLEGIYPPRDVVSIVEFAADFGYTVARVQELFDVDPTNAANANILSLVQGVSNDAVPDVATAPTSPPPAPSELPSIGEALFLNDGRVAELAVAKDLLEQGWAVIYTGNQANLGYDLRATKVDESIVVEVKSSVGYVTPVLTTSEWAAAAQYKSDFVLALVDFVGKSAQSIRYIRGPELKVEPIIIHTVTYRLTRAELDPHAEQLTDWSSDLT